MATNFSWESRHASFREEERNERISKGERDSSPNNPISVDEKIERKKSADVGLFCLSRHHSSISLDTHTYTSPFRFLNDETGWFSLMDVLELPRPVINFLRTMAKEGCRYTLSWDIFGGPDTVTLTLTWKLTDGQCQSSSVVNDSPSHFQPSTQAQISDAVRLHMKNSVSSPHRSRRERNNCVSAIFRSSRGKSAQTTNLPADQSNHHPLVSTLDRSTVSTSQKNHSDAIYTRGDYSSQSTPSTPLNMRNGSDVPRRNVPSTPVGKKPSLSMSRPSRITAQDDDDDSLSDPWVRRLEHSPSSERARTRATSENDTNKTNTSLGRVKFKAQPDYFWIDPFSFDWLSGNQRISMFDWRSCWPRQFLILHFDKQRRVMLEFYASCLRRRNDGWQNWLLSDSIRL